MERHHEGHEGRRTALAVLALITLLGSAFVLANATTAIAAPARTVSSVTSGGSILFIKNHNVWLSSPDGATQRQLTTDGTSSRPYRDPTQSDDGTVIVAVQDRFEQTGGFPRSY